VILTQLPWTSDCCNECGNLPVPIFKVLWVSLDLCATCTLLTWLGYCLHVSFWALTFSVLEAFTTFWRLGLWSSNMKLGLKFNESAEEWFRKCVSQVYARVWSAIGAGKYNDVSIWLDFHVTRKNFNNIQVLIKHFQAQDSRIIFHWRLMRTTDFLLW